MKYLEDQKLLTLRFSNGLLILPTIRYRLMCHKNQCSITTIKEKKSKWFMYKSLIQGLTRLKIKRKKILFFSSTLFNVEAEEKGHFFNSLDGYYYNIFPNDSLLIEDADEYYTWRTNNSYKDLSFIKTYIILFCTKISSICNKIKPIKNPDFNYIINNYPNIYSQSELSYWDYFNRIYYNCIRLFLKITKCKLIAVNCGSYGEISAPLIKAAHDLHIKVIEMQHGAITSEHAAYHADDFIVKDLEYSTYLPDSLYTFGKYWSRNIDWNYNIIPVGNPYLNNYVSKFNNNKINNDFLIISQPALCNEIISFAKELSVVFPDKKIRIRLHPKDSLEYYQREIKNLSNITLTVSSENLYKDISSLNSATLL